MNIAENPICQCNKRAGVKTLHPQVSVINLTGKWTVDDARLDCYAVLLRQKSDSQSGWNTCDFTDTQLMAMAPNAPIDSVTSGNSPEGGRLLLFHRDLLAFHSLGRHIADYTYFKYNSKESLFLSHSETTIVHAVFNDIDRELRWGIDTYSRTVLCDYIKLLLDYIRRFYLRQFITREDLNAGIMDRLNQALDDYMLSGRVRSCGLPSACRMAPSLGLSSAYLNDLVVHTSGVSMTDYVQQRRLRLAKQLIISGQYSDAYIASTLGYGCTDKFRELFKKLTGMETCDYR